MSKIAWIGVGNMGSRMSKRLMDAGHELIACDKVEENTNSLVEDGAGFAKNPAMASADAAFIFTMIPNSEILVDVVAGKEGIVKHIKKGSIVIDMSTVSPEASSEANQAIESAGCKFLRAPVTGSTVLAEQGKLKILCSGDKASYESALPLFETMSTKQYYLGENEEARYMKLAINMMMGTSCQMLAESLVFGESAGLDWGQMLDVFAESAAGSPLIKYKVEPLKKRDFTPAFTVKLMEKDLDLAIEIAKKNDTTIMMTSLVRQFFAAARATGKGELDFASVLLQMEEMAGIAIPKQ